MPSSERVTPLTLWQLLHPSCTIDDLGWLPLMILTSDPRPIREQLDERYAHGGGWSPMGDGRWEFNRDTHRLKYPGDPWMNPLAITKIRDETLILYPYAFVLVLQPDGSYEVARVD